MKNAILLILALAFGFSFKCENTGTVSSASGKFNKEKDLLLVQFDCKTDVDDVQSAAALATLLADSGFSGIKYHAVAGTYGIQEGLYVPPNELFQLAFGDNWSDAHENAENALRKVMPKITETLLNKGDIWIADAGQSDFTARLISALKAQMPEIIISQRIHVVQHSDWNEESTSPENLKFVKDNADYHKIADGNVTGNGTPGFRTPEFNGWKNYITDPELVAVWQLAIDISNKYNGKDGRYNNEAIAAGGLDFSDLSEVCWILGLQNIRDTEEFFSRYGRLFD